MALNMNEADIFGDDGMDELAGMSPEDIQRRSRLLETEIRVLKVFFAPAFLFDFSFEFERFGVLTCLGGEVKCGIEFKFVTVGCGWNSCRMRRRD